MNLPTFEDVQSAARQIAGAAHYTPTVTSRAFVMLITTKKSAER